eukprot:TRINITY_DN4077_c0_g1_i1.p1 TRINITY_DN4077_c0_g1~~TRINITY_DN4077_c0_g1_i1.p1  ORF type:complete len:405 (-),score=56.97 TRINITY_DN4077_c0_g1_i1:341-1555(-)
MNGTVECKVCGSKTVRQVSKAYDRHHSNPAKRFRALNILLVVSDCILIGLQPILVYMCKVDGKFPFSPVSVNFLTELMKIFFALLMIAFQVRKQRPGEKSLIDPGVVIQAARANYLLAVPACLYAVNNYLKFIMQLYFNPATVKMLSNLKVLMIALLLRIMMRRRFTITQWEALVLLLIGISVNQLHTTPDGTTAIASTVTYAAYLYTLVFVTVPSMASVFNEYALKSQYDTSVVLQSLFLYLWGAFFNCLALVVTTLYHGGNGVNIFQGHSKATVLLIVNNGAQGVLSSFFFKYADAILKKYSSTVATIFTGLASAALFGHALTINFLLGVTIVFISMHQFFSSMSKGKDSAGHQQGDGETHSGGMMKSKDSSISLVNRAAGATEEASHKLALRGEREPLLPT